VEGTIMKKSPLREGLCACAIAFSLFIASTNTAEAFVNNAGNYVSQDTHIHGMVTGANHVKRSGDDAFATDLQNTFFGISCGLIGLFLLRMANKR
jgi:hypothetical protein